MNCNTKFGLIYDVIGDTVCKKYSVKINASIPLNGYLLPFVTGMTFLRQASVISWL